MTNGYNIPSITQDGHEWIRVVDHVALVEKARNEGIIEGRKQVEKNWIDSLTPTKTDNQTEV